MVWTAWGLFFTSCNSVTETTETHQTSQELVIVGDMHGLPDSLKTAYTPMLNKLLAYEPEMVLGEYTVVGDTSAFGAWHSDFKLKYLEAKENFSVDDERESYLLNTANTRLDSLDFKELENYFLAKGDMANNWMYTYFKWYGATEPFDPRGNQNSDLTFQLMRKLGIKKIYGVDSHAGYDGYWPKWKECLEMASEENNQKFETILDRLDQEESNISDQGQLGFYTNSAETLDAYYRVNSLRYDGFEGDPCDIQRLKWDRRNKLIASNILKILDNGKYMKTVLIIGAGHALAVQKELDRIRPDLKLVMYREL